MYKLERWCSVLLAALTLVAQKSAEHVKTHTPDAIHWAQPHNR